MTAAAAVLWDCTAWLLIHCSTAGLTYILPLSWFRTSGWLYRSRSWERGGLLYNRLFAIRVWKRLLPDGAALFRGAFRKRRLADTSPAYLRRFAAETCRAELCHWLALAVVPIFALWNAWYVVLLMVLYATAVNTPCIVAQRYNRPRLLAMAARREGRQSRRRS